MFAGIAVTPFQPPGQLEQSRHFIILLNHFGQFGFINQCLFQRHFQIVGNQLGDGIHCGQFHIQHAPDIANHRLGLHRAEGDDLGDFILAVFVSNVANRLLAPIHAEINIEIGHGNAFGIKKALKQKPVLDRIKVSNLQTIGNQ